MLSRVNYNHRDDTTLMCPNIQCRMTMKVISVGITMPRPPISIVRAHLSQLLVAVWLCLATGSVSIAATPDTLSKDAFTLIDEQGNPFNIATTRGQVVVLFFGYTSCPDVCPTTLLSVKALMNRLRDVANRVQPIFVSVDPGRDTPEVLRRYTDYFHPSIIGITGNQDALRQLARRFHTSYRYEGKTDSGSYTVDHTSDLYILNPQGTLVQAFPYGTPIDVLVERVRMLLPSS